MRRAYAMLGLSLLGCDPTAGFADSADATLPDIKRYFDGRGTMLAEGPWHRVVVDVDADTLYHVGGRRLDDDEPTFHLFGQDAREGCRISPNAGTWLMAKAPLAPFRLLPFLETMDEHGRGRLRFTALDCTVQELAIDDAGRPYPRLFDRGYLVPTKNGYTFADPWTGETRPIVDDLQSVLLWGSAMLFWADGQLKSYSDQLEAGAAWGNAVVSLVQNGPDYLVEDADGLHRVTFDASSLQISAEPVLPGACRLQRATFPAGDSDTIWVSAQLPCGNPRPTVLHLARDTLERLDDAEVPLELDARHVRPLLTSPLLPDEPPPLAIAYVTEVDEDGVGKLWVWREGTEPVFVGERGQVESVTSEAPGGEWSGRAQVNHRTLGGLPVRDWVRFRWDGETEVLAEGVMRENPTGEVLVHFNGVSGDVPKFEPGGGYEVLASAVPPQIGPIVSLVGERHYARVDEFDGTAGRLRLGAGATLVSTWSAVGRRVPPEHARFAAFMPALVFIEEWDDEGGTGRLVAYNYELDARSTIAEGVSSFDLTNYPWPGVVYSVPAGEQRGIWLSKAK